MQSTLSSAPSAQVPFPEPPQVITTKDALYLKDAMSWELVAFKKLHFLAQQAKDPEVRQHLEKAGQMHQKHYQTLLRHLQTNNQAAMNAISQKLQSQQMQPQMQ